MKKLVFLAVAIALLVALGAVPASVDGPPNASQFCKAWAEWADSCHWPWCVFPFDSHGECVSETQACLYDGNTGPVCVCKTWGNLGYKDQGQCVSALRHIDVY
jgi:hypothetical protein